MQECIKRKLSIFSNFFDLKELLLSLKFIVDITHMFHFYVTNCYLAASFCFGLSGDFLVVGVPAILILLNSLSDAIVALDSY